MASDLKRFVAIAGNIGVGKSTLTARLAEKLGWQPFYEAVGENPYLADFYADMRRWSFHSQIFFLSRRLRHHYQLLVSPESVIQDRTVYEDAEVFARNLYQQGNMDGRDYGSYRELYEVMALFLPPPHLLVYLKASVPTLLERIAMRGREFERNMSPVYLQQLNELYDRWITTFEICPVLTVNADDLDFVRFDRHLSEIVDQILRRVESQDAPPVPMPRDHHNGLARQA
jgi:deoxyadenosine/deoxycytidine kinase